MKTRVTNEEWMNMTCFLLMRVETTQKKKSDFIFKKASAEQSKHEVHIYPSLVFHNVYAKDSV
jgi:hypothetical protein